MRRDTEFVGDEDERPSGVVILAEVVGYYAILIAAMLGAVIASHG